MMRVFGRRRGRNDEVRKVLFGCCFCGEPTEDGLALVETDSETSEMKGQWWCHEECLVERLHPEAARARALRDNPPDWDDADEDP